VVSRLDNILARHAERTRWTMHKVLWIAVATLIVVVGFLLLFTHVGMPDKPPAREHRVDDIKLMHAKPPAK
jgi:hypothetical protein